MRICNLIIATVLTFFMVSCGSNSESPNSSFSIEIKNAKKVYNNTETLIVILENKKNKEVESVTYSLDTELLTEVKGNQEASVNLSEQKLGKHSIHAQIKADGETYNVQTEITVVSSQKPKLYSYKIIETYPHDIEAYTQGLEFMNDTLYESTGQYKESTLRKTNYRTGEVYKQVALAPQFFGEGLTILNNKVYQLTWKENTGFIYDLVSLERKGTFIYGKSQQGWGLCNNGKTIFKSDGSEKIWSLNSETLSEEGYIQIYTNKSKIKSVNELEWVEGKIYANVYEQSSIAIINPSNGAVEGVIDLNGLKDQVTQHDDLNVLNGIAYNGEPNILYVTGKNWDKLFKIEIVEK